MNVSFMYECIFVLSWSMKEQYLTQREKAEKIAARKIRK